MWTSTDGVELRDTSRAGCRSAFKVMDDLRLQSGLSLPRDTAATVIPIIEQFRKDYPTAEHH